MTWIAAGPTALVAIVWLLIPGLLITYGLGLRGLAAWAQAPIVTTAVVAATAVAAGKLGVAWSVPLVSAVCLAVAAVTAGVTFLLRHRIPAGPHDARSVRVTAALGLLPAIVLGTVVIIQADGHPDALSQTYDAVFHYNALAYILHSHNASSLTLSSLGNPGVPAGFYPAGWHDLTSLILMTTGTTIPVAANLMSGVLAVVCWPLSCLLLVRQVIGPSRLALAVTGAVSVGFTAFPWGLLSFGVLWPNLLGMALAPAALAVVVSVCGLAKDDAIGRGRAGLLLPVTVVALALAHPNVLFSLVVLAIFPVGVALVRRAARPGHVLRGIGEIGVAAAVFGFGWWWAATTPVFASVRAQVWRPFDTPGEAVRDVLLNATDGNPALWALSVVVLIGVVCTLWRGRPWWLVGGYLLTGALYLLTAAVNTSGTRWITGYWYNDSQRLGAMLPITAVPLAVLAIVGVAGLVRWLLTRGSHDLGRSAAPVAVVLVLVLVVVSKGLYLPERVALVSEHYTSALKKPSSALVDPAERAFFAQVADDVPADSVVAANPWSGGVLLWALADRRTLFPHLGIAMSPAQKYLAAHLIDLATDPKACQFAEQLNVDYLLIGKSTFWQRNPAAGNYPGLADPGTRPGFELVATDGPRKLYQLVDCVT
ncbi:MAG TPA: DUF6541 family protein [Pseudonocardiaceae bacterium]|jgi:hypothetical protein|nr:DUF6541 family protein [Pseudonocardiaceae bacterium]